MDGDVLPLLYLCLDTFQLQHRGGKLEEASSFQDVDKMYVHSAHDIRDGDKCFAVVRNHCKQVLKQLNDTQLDFVLLSCEDDDESFNLITCLHALATLAFERGDTEALEEISTVISKCNASYNASILMNDLGVMLSLKAIYQGSEECFSIANNFFEHTEDHLNSAIVTLNLAALYIKLGEYQRAYQFSDLAANLCHDITMRTTNDVDLPMKVLKRVADILKELGNLSKFRSILRISVMFDIGGEEAFERHVSKWLMKVLLREEEGEKIEKKELNELSRHLFTLINCRDAQSLTADFVRTVLTAARVNYSNGHDENAIKLLKILECALRMSSGRKDPLYGWLLFQIGQFKLGCGMISDAEKSLKQAEPILMKCHGGKYHLVAYCKKLIGSCALLSNDLEGALTNLNDALTFFSDINSQHFELADISLKLSQLQIEKGNFQDAKEILRSSLVKLTDSCGEISPKTASGYVQAGLILEKVDKEAAIDKVNEAIDILQSLDFPIYHPDVKLCQRLIGLFHLSLGKKQEAEKCFVYTWKESIATDESKSIPHHYNIPVVDFMTTEVNVGYLKESPLHEMANMLSLFYLVPMKKKVKDRQNCLDFLVSCLEESAGEQGITIEFAGQCCFVTRILCSTEVNIHFVIWRESERCSLSSDGDETFDEVTISRSKSSCILFWRSSCAIQEIKESKNLDFQIRESVSTLFMQPKFRKSFEEREDFYLQLPVTEKLVETRSLCSQVDCLPILVEMKLMEPSEDSVNFDYLTSWASCTSTPDPSIHVSCFSCNFPNKRAAELAFDLLVFSSDKGSMLSKVKGVEVRDSHFSHNFAFFTTPQSIYSQLSVFVDLELPVLRVKCRQLNDSKSDNFDVFVKSALDSVVLSVQEAMKINFVQPFAYLSCPPSSDHFVALKLKLSCSSLEGDIPISKETLEVDKGLHPNSKGLVNEGTRCREMCALVCNERSTSKAFAVDCSTEVTRRATSSSFPLQNQSCREMCALVCNERSTSEAFAAECSTEVTQRATSSSFPFQNQEFLPVSCVDVCLCLLDSMLHDRSADYKQKSSNRARPSSLVFSSHDNGSPQGNLSFLSSESVPSLSLLPKSPDSDIQRTPAFPLSFPKCSGPQENFVNEPLVCSSGDNIDAHLRKPQTRQETKDEDHSSEILQRMTSSNVSENPVNFDSTACVLRQKDEHGDADVHCTEANECCPVQMAAKHCASDENLSQEILSPVTQRIETRAVQKSRFHPGMLKREEECAASQICYSFELQEEVKKLKEQLREREAEIQQLKAELGRYLFLEDKEKRSGKLQLLPRAPPSDESRQCADSSSCNETSLDRRLHVEGASLKKQSGPSLRTIFIDISNSLSTVEFQHMKELAKGKVNDLRLARMKVTYELLDELERVSEDSRTDIRELLESIQRPDLLEKLGVSLHEGIAAVSPASLPLKDKSLDSLSTKDDKKRIVPCKYGVPVRSSPLSGEADGGRISGNQEDNSFASISSFESSAENEREIPTSKSTENYEGLPLERVRADSKGDTHVPFTPDQAGPSSILSNTNSNSSDSLVSNSAEGAQVPCLRGGSSGSCEETEPTETFQATGFGFSDGITSGRTSLNTGSFEGGISQEGHFSDSEDNVTDGSGNNETTVDDMQGTSVESCNRETRSSRSGLTACPAFVESDSGIRSSGNSAYLSLSTGHEGLIVGDGNQLTLQHNSIVHDKRTVGRGKCDPDCSSKTGTRLPLRRNSKEYDEQKEDNCELVTDSSLKTGNQLLMEPKLHDCDQQKEERREPGSDCSSKTANQLPLQQNSKEHDQQTEGSREPEASYSSDRNWERQGARPKRTQMQRPMDPPLWPSSSPVSDGLTKDFLARHSQDRAVQGSLYTHDKGLSFVGPERLRDASFVDGPTSASEAWGFSPRHSQDRSIQQSLYTDDRGLISASEAYSERPYFGAMGTSSYEGLGGAYSDVRGGSAVRAGLLGSHSSSTHAAAAPLPGFNGQTHLSSVWSGMSSDGVNTSNRLLPPNNFATSDHSLTGEQDFSRECESLLNQNFLIGRLISPNPHFVYGSTSSNFTGGIVPRYLIYGVQSHVLSDGNSALMADQRSHHSNLNLESQSSQFGDREQAEAPFAANGIVWGMLVLIPPSL
ncbi:PREDICTED: uncharacterized protein LOC107344017 isoform X3 [Acropora digitifera]|uniref:uncharacterized protein LOC107344017 isoform X3 n=1 Tax=Acropora digitifera TaxID=70779 RepID=UPI000779F579|nr:PREDICTED: uncharacterized protein LOC107344017 isoform X3 [Acropora digitifera]